MPLATYKLLTKGAALNDGATGSFHIGIAGIAKKASVANPFIVANELVCNGIARALSLPCPPGAIMEDGGETYFFALNFNLAGHALPPIPAAAVVAEHPRMAWLIIVFDVLIINNDRHRRNISYDVPTKRLQIFDHSHALLVH